MNESVNNGILTAMIVFTPLGLILPSSRPAHQRKDIDPRAGFAKSMEV